MDPSCLSLSVLSEAFAICRLSEPAAPPVSNAGPLHATTLTANGCTVVCTEDRAPAGSEIEAGWSCLEVQGPLPFSMTGVLAALTGPLAAAGIPVFALSTYETDYLLVKSTQLRRTVEVLSGSGHTIGGMP